MQMNESQNSNKAIPPIYFIGALVLALLLHAVFPLGQLLASPWTWFGVVPIVGGGILILIAGWSFNRQNTTVKPFAYSTTLVTNGVFRLSRNPMYLGLALILIGVVLLLGSTTPLLPALVFPVLLDRIFIVAEEHKLEEAFGEQFREYRKRVRRWV
jgi:protein-S-isoprenylcysteine O-methyltransferase Ste14